MSGINKFLGRKEKHAKAGRHESVMSPPSSSNLPTPNSSSNSSLRAFSAVSALLFPSHGHSSSSSSLSSLSLAFSHPRPKGSPRLQATGGTVESSTANTSDYYLLQPRQVSGHLHGIFTDQEERLPDKDEEQKIKALSQKLAAHGITHFKHSDLEYVLNATYTQGSQEKAFDLLVLLEESENGIVKECDPDRQLLGAVNLNGVTCYLDALLFAIFARLSTFEAVLYNTFDDEPRRKLTTLLRLWVNTLRSGKLITVDVTKQLQGALVACGWPEAAGRCQQDASEAFSFIMHTLELPTITLKTDIFHSGKEEVEDDHRFITERILEVGIPEELGDTSIRLEDCLEYHFNSRIEVTRALERRATLDAARPRNSIDSSKGHASHIQSVEVDASQPTTPLTPAPQSPLPPYSSLLENLSRPGLPSILQDQYPSEKSEGPSIPSTQEDSESYTNRPRASSTAKAMIMMPAWQFFSLIPWYTDNIVNKDSQMAAHYSSKRPVLGICLKRYAMVSGQVVRRGTHVDIPLEIGLPHFIHPDTMADDASAFGNFKLVLQSIVCHRGENVNSGHYVSLVRDQAPQAVLESGLDGSSPNDRWMLFDDLANERVSYVDIEEYLNKETPYLMFYQVHPLEGEIEVIDGTEIPSDDSLNGRDSKDSKDSGVAGLSVNGTESMDSNEKSPAVSRPTFDGHAPDARRGRSSMMSDRRLSVNFTDTSAPGPKQDQPTETDANGLVSGNASLAVSRQGSRNGSRNGKKQVSQSGDKRLSASFSRLANRLTKDKTMITVEALDPTEIERPPHSNAISAQQGEAMKQTGHRKEQDKRRSGNDQPTKGKLKAKRADRDCIIM